jgi:hypothetical protein
MARPNANRTRRKLLDLASQLAGSGRGELSVLIVRGQLVTVRREPPVIRPGQVAGLRPYDAAIVRALTDQPVSSQRLAARAGHRFNSHFRGRLSALVESGHVRRTRRGYLLPTR